LPGFSPISFTITGVKAANSNIDLTTYVSEPMLSTGAAEPIRLRARQEQ